MKRIRLALAFALPIFFVFSCSSVTKVTATWKAEPAESTTYKNLAIIGIAKRADVRKAVEAAIEDALAAKGYRSTGALMFLPPQATRENITKDIVVEILKSNGFDAVMTISLVQIDKKQEYSGGVSVGVYVPAYYNQPFYDYYGSMSGYAYSPGYYTETTDVYLETNIFSFPEGKLIWSAQTATYDLTNVEQTAQDLATAIVESMVKDQVVPE